MAGTRADGLKMMQNVWLSSWTHSRIIKHPQKNLKYVLVRDVGKCQDYREQRGFYEKKILGENYHNLLPGTF